VSAAARLWLPCLLATTGCVRLSYLVQHVEEPVVGTAVGVLQPGADDLGSCLRLLGAPHFVWEYRGDGMALGWVYSDAAGWSLTVSYTVTRFVTPSFDMDMEDTDLPGAVLWFDRDLRLLEMREGRMRDLTSGLRRRPAPVEDG
jgi:hypothetical protein